MSIDAKTERMILDHFDGQLTADQQVELAHRMASDPAVRQAFARYMRLEGTTYEFGAAGLLAEPQLLVSSAADDAAHSNQVMPAVRSSSSVFRSKWIWTAASLAALILLSSLWWLRPSWEVETSQPILGSVVRSIGAVQQDQPIALGHELTTGLFSVDSGIVELEMANGVEVILEGPARWELLSADRTVLHSGRLRSNVPPAAYGFTVEANSVRVVDLGTEFGIDADTEGLTEVHVFDGEVEVEERSTTKPVSATRRLLSAGEAMRMEPFGGVQDIPADRNAFVDQEGMERRAVSFVTQLRHDTKELNRQRQVLERQMAERERSVRTSKSLQRLRRQANAAREKLNAALASDSAYQHAVRQRDKVKAEFEQKIHAALQNDPKTATQLRELDELAAQLPAFKKEWNQLQKSRGDVAEKRKLQRQMRDAQRKKIQLMRIIRNERNRIRNQNPEIQIVWKRLGKANRQCDEVLSHKRFDAVRKEANRRRLQFTKNLKQQMQSDKSLATLRQQHQAVLEKLKENRQLVQAARALDRMVETDAQQTEWDLEADKEI